MEKEDAKKEEIKKGTPKEKQSKKITDEEIEDMKKESEIVAKTATGVLNTEPSEYMKYVYLRQDILSNIQLVDNKINAYIISNRFCNEALDMFFEALTPRLNNPDPPEGYQIFNAIELEHIKYQCNVCRDILLVKHEFLKRALTAQKNHEDRSKELMPRMQRR